MPLARGRGRVGYQHEFCLNKDHSKAVREALKKEYPQMKIRVKIDDCHSMVAWLVSGNQKLNDDNFEPVKEAIEQTMMDALKTFDDTEDERVIVFCYLGDWTKNQDYIQNAESSAMTYNAEMDANVLFRQLGGNRFRAMTGAKDFMKDGNSLRMKIMKNNTGGNHLIITLNSNDLYDMRFESHRLNRKTYELTVKVKAEEKNIPASDLQRVFTRLSGLYTRMAEQSFNAENNLLVKSYQKALKTLKDNNWNVYENKYTEDASASGLSESHSWAIGYDGEGGQNDTTMRDNAFKILEDGGWTVVWDNNMAGQGFIEWHFYSENKKSHMEAESFNAPKPRLSKKQQETLDYIKEATMRTGNAYITGETYNMRVIRNLFDKKLIEFHPEDKHYKNNWKRPSRVIENDGVYYVVPTRLGNEYGYKFPYGNYQYGSMKEWLDNQEPVFDGTTQTLDEVLDELFGADDLKFKEWADQEMKTHGKKESFDDWLDDELKSHGDNVSLQDWGHHELDSHYERYGAEDYEVIYRVKAKYSPDEKWEIIGDFDKKEDGERVFNKFIGSTYELRLIEIETMYEDDAPMEEVDRLIMNYSSYGENGIQTFNAEIDGEELIASSANFSDGSMIVGVGTETLDVDNPDFMEMMIDKDGKIEYFTLPIGKGGWDRHYNIKPSHYGKMKTQNETNETAGGDFIRTDGEGKYAESFNADAKEKRNWIGFCPECQKWRDYEKGRTYKGYRVQPLSYFDEELGVWVCNKQHSYYRHESAYENAGYYKMPCGEPLRKSKNANAPKVGKDKKAVGASAYINQSQKEMIKTIKMCMKYANNNPWKDGKTTEKTFLEDMLERLKKGRDLTEGQANVTNRITGNIIRKNDLYWEAESFNAYQVDLPECCKDTEWIWRQAGLEEDKMVQLWKLQKPVIAKLRKSLKIPADVCLFPFWKDYISEGWQLVFPYHAIYEGSTELLDMDDVSVGKVSKGLIGELRKVAIPDDLEPHSLDQLLSSRKAENFNSETKSLPYKWIAGAIALGFSIPYLSSLLNSGTEK